MQNIFFNKSRPKKNLVYYCALLVAVNPLAMDLYLPAFEEIKNYFDATYQSVNLTLSLYIIFSAIGFLLGGSLSDFVGRKKVILFGLLIYLFCTVAITLSQTIEQVIVFRSLQGFSGALAIVNAAAILRDLYPAKIVAKMYARTMAIMLVTPMLAPVLGLLIMDLIGWKGIFYALFGYGLAIALLTIVAIPETAPKFQQLRLKTLLQNLRFVLFFKHNNIYQSLLLLSINTLTFALFLLVIINSTFIFVDHFNQTLNQLTFHLAINGLALMIGFYGVNYVSKRLKPITILRTTATIQVVTLASLLYLVNVTHIHVLTYSIFLAFTFIFNGMTASSVVALYIKPFKTVAGTASSLQSTYSLFFNGLLAFIPFIWLPLTFINITVLQLVCIGIVWLLTRLLPKLIEI